MADEFEYPDTIPSVPKQAPNELKRKPETSSGTDEKLDQKKKDAKDTPKK